MTVHKELSKSQIIIWTAINGIIIFYCLVLFVYYRCFHREKEYYINNDTLLNFNGNHYSYFKRPFSDFNINTSGSLTLGFMKNAYNKTK